MLIPQQGSLGIAVGGRLGLIGKLVALPPNTWTILLAGKGECVKVYTPSLLASATKSRS